MKKVIKIQTEDGKLHDNHELARIHANKRYQATIDTIARSLFAHIREAGAKVYTPTTICAWLDNDANRAAVQHLSALKADLDLEEQEDQCE